MFAEKLGHLGLDPYVMLVVDLMHEFKLGVWKAVFTHVIGCQADDLTQEL